MTSRSLRPLRVWCISGSRSCRVLVRTRSVDNRRIHDGPGTEAQSLGLQVFAYPLKQPLPQLVLLQQMTELAHRGLVRTGTGPRSMRTNCRIPAESYCASSTPRSDRLNHCCKKQIRSIHSAPTGGRPFPASAYTGSTSAHNSAHGTTCSISSKNNARRVFFV